MNLLKSILARLLAEPKTPLCGWKVIIWWEARRIPYNVILVSFGLVAFGVFLWSIETSGHLKPGEDAVEPLALPLGVVVANLFYTLGWLVEATARWLFPQLPAKTGVALWLVGTAFSLLVISVPALVWAAYRLIQILGVVR